jgi:hypothetical protein
MRPGRSLKRCVMQDGRVSHRAAETNSGETYKNEKRGQLDRIELPLFFGFFTVKFFSHLPVSIPDGPADLVGPESPNSGGNKRASDRHRRPVLTSETTKRKNSNIFHCALFSCYVYCPAGGHAVPLYLSVSTGHCSPDRACYTGVYKIK